MNKLMAKRQIELIEKIQEMNINLVTCGHCGVVQLIDTTSELVECYDCGGEGEQCDYPDLFHNGMTIKGVTIV